MEHTHYHRLVTKERTLSFWCRNLYRMPACDSCQKLVHVSHCKEHHITRNYIKDLTSSWSPQQSCITTETFSGYIITAAVWWANSGHSIVSPEINSCNGYIPDQNSPLNSASFVKKVILQWINIQSTQWCFILLFTSIDKHFNSPLKIQLRTIYTTPLYPFISSHILVRWMNAA